MTQLTTTFAVYSKLLSNSVSPKRGTLANSEGRDELPEA